MPKSPAPVNFFPLHFLDLVSSNPYKRPLVVSYERGRFTNTAMHYHAFYEMVIICGGTGRYESDGQQHSLQAGDVLLLKPYEGHRYYEEKDMELINILWNPKLLKLDFHDLTDTPGYQQLFNEGHSSRVSETFPQRVKLPASQLQPIITLAQQIRAELISAAAGALHMAVSYLGLLIGQCCRYGMEPTGEKSSRGAGVELAVDYIQAHYQEPLHRSMLARMCNMSAKSFFLKFKRLTDLSPREYLLQYRLHQAEQLLRQTDETILQIATESGFYDNCDFCRQFRRHFQQSPRQYRQAHPQT